MLVPLRVRGLEARQGPERAAGQRILSISNPGRESSNYLQDRTICVS